MQVNGINIGLQIWDDRKHGSVKRPDISEHYPNYRLLWLVIDELRDY